MSDVRYGGTAELSRHRHAVNWLKEFRVQDVVQHLLLLFSIPGHQGHAVLQVEGVREGGVRVAPLLLVPRLQHSCK